MVIELMAERDFSAVPVDWIDRSAGSNAAAHACDPHAQDKDIHFSRSMTCSYYCHLQ
jgi:hypothetical protein